MSWLALALILLSATIHAVWNLLAHSQKLSGTLILRLNLFTGIVGIIPVLIFELQADPFPANIWFLVILSGFFQSFYCLGLMMGYRHGKFSIVYPIARALPILFLAFFDIIRGDVPSISGWIGIILITIGCILAPIKSLDQIKVSDYWNRSTIWILVIMFSTVAYTVTDKIAAELFPTGATSAARYAILQSIFVIPFFLLILKLIGEPLLQQKGIAAWRWPALFAFFVFVSYWLMLWAFQLAPNISYLAALRQFSLVIGVILAAVVLREDVPKMRIFAAAIIVLGMICVSKAS